MFLFLRFFLAMPMPLKFQRSQRSHLSGPILKASLTLTIPQSCPWALPPTEGRSPFLGLPQSSWIGLSRRGFTVDTSCVKSSVSTNSYKFVHTFNLDKHFWNHISMHGVSKRCISLHVFLSCFRMGLSRHRCQRLWNLILGDVHKLQGISTTKTYHGKATKHELLQRVTSSSDSPLS